MQKATKSIKEIRFGKDIPFLAPVPYRLTLPTNLQNKKHNCQFTTVLLIPEKSCY